MFIALITLSVLLLVVGMYYWYQKGDDKVAGFAWFASFILAFFAGYQV